MLRLRDAGNTLVVVEHDPAVMLAADRMIDMGPGPGERGGQIVFDGSTNDLRSADTLTGAYLGGRKHVGFGFKRMVTESTPRLILEGAREHNLKDVTVEFPLQRLVTAVSYTHLDVYKRQHLRQRLILTDRCTGPAPQGSGPVFHQGACTVHQYNPQPCAFSQAP